MSDRKEFSGTMPTGRWPEGPQLAVAWELMLVTIWEAEWAPLRQEKFCAHLAENLATAIEEGMGPDFAAHVLVILNDEDDRLTMLVRAGGFYRGGRQAEEGDAGKLSALLNDEELSKSLIWAAINDTAYKGVLE